MKHGSRTQNSIRNIFSGIINRIVLLVFPFIVRTLLVNILGESYLGLSSLFTSILNVLNLTELGFGSALVFSMYKPIEQGDNAKVCALLSVYKKIYRIIGLCVLGIGLIILPFLKCFIKGECPTDINIYVLYLIYLGNTTISYLACAYKKSLLTAYQRSDVISTINSIVNITMYVVQMLLLIMSKNYYMYIIVIPACTILDNIVTSIFVNKKFPNLRCNGTITEEEKKKLKEHVKGISLQKLCSATRNTFDSIVISIYLGLNTVAIYNNYYFIMSSIHAFLYLIPNAIRASVGNCIVSENKAKNFRNYKMFSFLYNWISTWCCVCLFCLYQPFMCIWMGESRLLPLFTVALFCAYFFELGLGDMTALYKDAAGLWWIGRYRTIIEAVANLILNFWLGKLWGINGILVATLITTLLLGVGYGGYIVYHHCFVQEKYVDFVFGILKNSLSAFLTVGLTYIACIKLPVTKPYSILFARAILCVFVPNFVMWLVHRKSIVYSDAKQFIKGAIANYTIKKIY